MDYDKKLLELTTAVEAMKADITLPTDFVNGLIYQIEEEQDFVAVSDLIEELYHELPMPLNAHTAWKAAIWLDFYTCMEITGLDVACDIFADTVDWYETKLNKANKKLIVAGARISGLANHLKEALDELN